MADMQTTADSKRRELISFRIGRQEFCVDIMAVKEIRGWAKATPLPHAPAYVQGMINLRGTVLPVIEMATRLGIPSDAHEKARRVIVVVWIGTRLVGLVVDAVCDILTVTDEAVQSTPDVACESIRNFVSAVLTIDERMICLIALEHLLPELDAAA
jgi:purine-binding chemotaxis protein CheW